MKKKLKKKTSICFKSVLNQKVLECGLCDILETFSKYND
jgi:hypothetical protein